LHTIDGCGTIRHDRTQAHSLESSRLVLEPVLKMKPTLIFKLPLAPTTIEIADQEDKMKESLKHLKEDFNVIVQTSSAGPWGLDLIHDSSVTLTNICSH
jgi:hypothetical protein